MAGDVSTLERGMALALDKALGYASSIITKDYLEKLDRLPIVRPSAAVTDVDVIECGKFYKLSRLVINKEENFLHKLTTIVNVVSAIDCTLATVIKSDGIHIDYYIGIVSKNAKMQNEEDQDRREANEAAFHGAINGNLIGSETVALTRVEMEALQQALENPDASYAAVSGIVALRDERERDLKAYVQGLENLTDALKGKKYTILMLADPLETSEIQTIKEGYEILATSLSVYEKSMLTINESDTQSFSETQSKNVSRSISSGIAFTQGGSESKGTSTGKNSGFCYELGIGIYSDSRSSVESKGKSKSFSTGTTSTKGVSYGSGETSGMSISKNAGRSLQISSENRSVKALVERIDKQLKRLDECESFGAFDCAAYVIADDKETALTVASNYNALMRGEKSCVQASHINVWDDKEKIRLLGEYLSAMTHPRFWQDEDAKQQNNTSLIVTPASIISGDELAIEVALPKKSIPGITVIPMIPFGRNIETKSSRTLSVGTLYYMGQKEVGRNVSLDVESLAMHTFITGSTGAGKSTVIYSLLDKLKTLPVEGKDEAIKFMVVEPAKGEYKNRFGNEPDVHVYGTNAQKTPLLRINPFSFPEDVHVLEHIDRLIEIFNVCWPMYAAMPAVLKDAVEQAYISAGWDLETSECKYINGQGIPLYPTFADVLREITQVIDQSSYSADSKGDYKGALCTRLKSLTNGLYRQIFTSDELSGKELFDENVIVDLSRMGSSETKSLVMGLLVMKMQEYRMANAGTSNAKLKHVTVIEEAHHLLKRVTFATGAEGTNMFGKSVEMLSNSIAEMRTYGEGFIIADQAPGLMDLSVIRNTNTKIILRLPDKADRELVGRAAGLNDSQIDELAKLKTGVAAVYQNDWMEPVLCKIEEHKNSKANSFYQYIPSIHRKDMRAEYIQFLTIPFARKEELDQKYINSLVNRLFELPVSAATKTVFLQYVQAKSEQEASKYGAEAMYEMVDAESIFERVYDKNKTVDGWYRYIKDSLEPSLSLIAKEDRDKILLAIIEEQVKRTGLEELKVLVDRILPAEGRR